MGIIGSIRKHSWIPVLIVGIAIVAFIIGDLTKNQRGVPDVGEIDGHAITYQHFERKNNELKSMVMRNQGITTLSQEMEARVREQTWESLLQEAITAKEYNALGIKISNDELNDMYTGNFIHPYLRQMFTDPQTGQYNTQIVQYYTENFEALDTAARQQWVDIEESVVQDREQQKYSSLIAQAMYMPAPIAAKIAEIDNYTSDVRVSAVTYQSLANEEAVPTEQDYKNYYNKHRQEYRVLEEQRELEYVVFQVTPTLADMSAIQNEVMKVWDEFQTLDTASETDIAYFVTAESSRSYDSTFYRSSQYAAPFDSLIAHTPAGKYIEPRQVGNEWMMARVLRSEMRPDSMRASVIWILNNRAGEGITRTKEQAEALADSVVALVSSNRMSFEAAVQQYSDQKDNDGDMGWGLDGAFGFLNERMLRTPVDGIFVMEHPQKLGQLIVKVSGKTAPTMKYRVAMINRPIVPSAETEKGIYNLANQFAGQNRTYAEMVAAAQEQNLPVRQEMVRMMQSSMQGINNARDIVRWAFDEKVKIGNVADQVFNLDNMYVVCALKDIYHEGYATLEQVRQYIEQPVVLDKKAEVLMARADEAKKGATDITTYASKMGVTVDTVRDVTLTNPNFNPYGMEILVQSSVACQAAAGNKALYGPIKGSQGVYMIQVDNVAQRTETADAESIRYQMLREAQNKASAVMQVLREKIKIKDQRNKFF